MTQLIPRGAIGRACVLFSDLVEGRREKVDGELDASLRGNVDLAREWATVAGHPDLGAQSLVCSAGPRG